MFVDVSRQFSLTVAVLTDERTVKMGTLVDQQDETVNAIEATAQDVEGDTEKA